MWQPSPGGHAGFVLFLPDELPLPLRHPARPWSGQPFQRPVNNVLCPHSLARGRTLEEEIANE